MKTTTEVKPLIDVQVKTEYLTNQSQPAENQYAFAYHIRIVNQGNIDATLLKRHWIIIDANQQQQEVKGIGVIGEQPLITCENIRDTIVFPDINKTVNNYKPFIDYDKAKMRKIVLDKYNAI
jgi:hypothetical protein